MNFCKDCTHYKEVLMCMHSNNRELVFGDYATSARTLRRLPDKCGPSGNWFSPKRGTTWTEPFKPEQAKSKLLLIKEIL